MPPRAHTFPRVQAGLGVADARREVTLEAALEDAEARFRRLVEQVPTVTYICDFDESVSVRYISPQIEALTGYPAERWTDASLTAESVGSVLYLAGAGTAFTFVALTLLLRELTAVTTSFIKIVVSRT